MKRLFIVTMATLMATSAFAGRVNGTMEKAREEVKEMEKKAGGKLSEAEIKRLTVEIAKEIAQGSKVSAAVIEKGLDEAFGTDLIAKVNFRSALLEAKKPGQPDSVTKSATSTDFLLQYLGEGLSKEYAVPVTTLVTNYAELMQSLGTEVASVKFETQLRSLALAMHPTFRNQYGTDAVKAADDITKVSLYNAFKTEAGKFESKGQVRSKAELDALSDKDKKTLEDLLTEFKNACGKKRG